MNSCGKYAPALIRVHPFLEHFILDPPHGFHLWDAGISYAVHMPVQQCLFIFRCQIAVTRYPLVVIVRH